MNGTTKLRALELHRRDAILIDGIFYNVRKVELHAQTVRLTLSTGVLVVPSLIEVEILPRRSAR